MASTNTKVSTSKQCLDGDFAFQAEILKDVSRSFALTIPKLPDETCKMVTNLYLLLRIADTIEDDPALSLAQTKLFLDRFIEVIAGREQADSFAKDLSIHLSSSSSDAEKYLIVHTARVIRITHSFSLAQQTAIERCARIMANGMIEFEGGAHLDGLEDLGKFDSYCYHVAGVIGEALTDLFSSRMKVDDKRYKELLHLSVSFGQGLQMVNIIKDTWKDRERGVCWLPRDVFQKFGVDLSLLPAGREDSGFSKSIVCLLAIAHFHLGNALQYVLKIPRREAGIRRHCLIAVGIAVLTLHRIHAHPAFKNGNEVKISHFSLRATIATTYIFGRSNLALKVLFKVFSRCLPKLSEHDDMSSYAERF